MKNLLSKYSDDSDSDSSHENPTQISSIKRLKPDTPQKNPIILPLSDPKNDHKSESDSEQSDGDFIRKAKKITVEPEKAEKSNLEIKIPAKKEDLSQIEDPLAKSLFSALPAPKNILKSNPIKLEKVRNSKENTDLIKDLHEQDFLLNYSNVQQAKNEIKYSTDTDKNKEKIQKDENGNKIEGEVIEIKEKDYRDDKWKIHYMKNTDKEKTNQMEEYLQQNPIGEQERSKNQITHLAYQSMKQQISAHFSGPEPNQRDGRKKYGW